MHPELAAIFSFLLLFGTISATKVYVNPTVSPDFANRVYQDLPSALWHTSESSNYDPSETLEFTLSRGNHFITSQMLPEVKEMQNSTGGQLFRYFAAFDVTHISIQPLYCEEIDEMTTPFNVSSDCIPNSRRQLNEPPDVRLYVKAPLFHFRFHQSLSLKDVTLDGSELMVWKNCSETVGGHGCCEASLNSHSLCCDDPSQFQLSGGCQLCQFYQDGRCPSGLSATRAAEIGVNPSHFSTVMPLFVLDASMVPVGTADSPPTLSLSGVKIQNFLNQLPSIINFRTPGTLLMNNTTLHSLSTTAGVITSNLETIVDLDSGSGASIFSLGNWATDTLLQHTLQIPPLAGSYPFVYDVRIESSEIYDINTVSLPAPLLGREPSFFSTNAAFLRINDFHHGKITIEDSEIRRIYADLLLEEQDISLSGRNHIGGGAIIILGSSMSIKISSTTIEDVMGATGAIRIKNFLPEEEEDVPSLSLSSLSISDCDILRSHGIYSSALYVDSDAEMEISATGTLFKNNIMSTNRILSPATPSALLTFEIPIGDASSPVILIQNCHVIENYGIEAAIFVSQQGGNLHVDQCTVSRNGNMIYPKYKHSFANSILPSWQWPKSSGVARAVTSVSTYNYSITNSVFDSNWTRRNSGSWAIVYFYNLYNSFTLNDNRVLSVLGQEYLEEEDGRAEWGLDENQDPELNLNWEPVNGHFGQAGGLIQVMFVARSPFTHLSIQRNVIQDVYLNGDAIPCQIYGGLFGGFAYHQLEFTDNTFRNYSSTEETTLYNWSIAIFGVQKLTWSRNTLDNSRWRDIFSERFQGHDPGPIAQWGRFVIIGQDYGAMLPTMYEIRVDNNELIGLTASESLFMIEGPRAPVFVGTLRISQCECPDCPLIFLFATDETIIFDNLMVEDSRGRLFDSSVSVAPFPKIVIINTTIQGHDGGGYPLVSIMIPFLILVNNAFIGNYNTGSALLTTSGGVGFPFQIYSHGNVFMLHTDTEGSDGIFELSDGVFHDSHSLYFRNSSGTLGGVYRAISDVEIHLTDCIFYENYAQIAGAVIFASSNSSVLSTRNRFMKNGKRVLQTNFPDADLQEWYFPGTKEIFLRYFENVVVFSRFGQDFYDHVEENWSKFTSFEERSLISARDLLLLLPSLPSSTEEDEQEVTEVPTITNQGGVVSLTTQSSFKSFGDIFAENYANDGSVMQSSSSDSTQSSLQDATIEGNSARVASLRLLNSNLHLESITMRGNLADEITQGIFLLSSSLTAKDCLFQDQGQDNSPSSGFISATTLSTVDIEGCQFEGGKGQFGGAITLSVSEKLKIKQSSFIGHRASNGGVLFSVGTTLVDIESTFFGSNYAQAADADLYISESEKVMVTSCQFFGGNLSGKVSIEDSEEVIMNITRFSLSDDSFPSPKSSDLRLEILERIAEIHTEFNGNSQEDVDGEMGESGEFATSSPIRLLNVIQTSIDTLLVENSTAVSGGALHVDATLMVADEREISSLVIRNSVFYRNSSTRNGGAIKLQEVPEVVIVDSAFYGNVSTKGSGGGIYSSCRSKDCSIRIGALEDHNEDDNDFEVVGTKFIANIAAFQGGALKWEDVKPEADLKKIQFHENKCEDREDFAGVSYALALIADSTTSLATLQEIQDSSSSVQTPTLFQEFRSGAPVEELGSLFFALVDSHGQVIQSDSSSFSEIFLTETSSPAQDQVAGEISLPGSRIRAENGIFDYSKLILSSTPNTTSEYVIKSSLPLEYPLEFQRFKIAFRDCRRGEIRTSDETCHVCGSELPHGVVGWNTSRTYSLSTEDRDCAACPQEAYCWGADKMGPKPGFWRIRDDTSTFLSCPNIAACLGARPGHDEDMPGGRCDEENGYTGALCKECLEGYSVSFRSTCAKCPPLGVNILRFVGLMILVLLIMGVLVRSSLRSAQGSKEKDATYINVYLRIFANYLQLVSLTSTLELQWPQEFRDLFNSQDQIGSIAEHISFDCFLQGSDTTVKIVYLRLLITNILPVMIFLGSLLVWGIIKSFSKKEVDLRGNTIATIVIVFFLAHPSIMKQNFMFFSCIPLGDGKTYLDQDLSEECWVGRHISWALTVAFPGIVVWVIAAPVFSIWILYKNQNNLEDHKLKQKFGFLYNGLQRRYFFWESLVLARKLAIAGAVIFLANSIEHAFQALICIGILAICYNIQEKYLPYAEYSLNSLESRSIVVSVVTLYCGLYFQNEEKSRSSVLILFFLLITANVYFFVFWIYHLSIRVGKLLRQKYPKIYAKFYSCGKKSSSKYTAVVPKIKRNQQCAKITNDF